MQANHFRKERVLLINRLTVYSQGAKLNVLEFRGKKDQDILLLHGLAGCGMEWESTADWLIKFGRVLAPDQRGHGTSQFNVTDFSRHAYVEDAIQIIEKCCDKPVVLIGQSMGGLNAFLLAAKRPDLVKALIVVEATPEQNSTAQEDIRNWLNHWPVPFKNLGDAIEYFGGDTLYGRTFAKSLVKREDGYWPAFKYENMIHSLDDVVDKHYWNEWQQIICPTLIVAGEKGSISKDILTRMVSAIPDGRYIYVPNAGHDLHLDNPQAWRKTVEDFFKDQGLS